MSPEARALLDALERYIVALEEDQASASWFDVYRAFRVWIRAGRP